MYARVFGEANYATHDSYDDVQESCDIFIASKFSKILEEKVKVYSRELESIEKKEEISRQMEDERSNLYKMIKSDFGCDEFVKARNKCQSAGGKCGINLEGNNVFRSFALVTQGQNFQGCQKM